MVQTATPQQQVLQEAAVEKARKDGTCLNISGSKIPRGEKRRQGESSRFCRETELGGKGRESERERERESESIGVA